MPKPLGMRRRAIFAIVAMLLPMTILLNQPAVANPAPTADVPASSIRSVINFIRSHPAEYSGIYLDRATGRYVVGVPAGKDESAALAKVTSSLDPSKSSGRQVALVTTQQKRSLADLMAVHARISSQYGEFGAMAGADVSQWGLDEDRNAVQVGVLRMDDALVASAQRTYGDSVYLRKVERRRTLVRQDPVGDVRQAGDYGPAWDRQLDAQPYWAGDQIGWIERVDGRNRLWRCTSGWMSGVRLGQFIGPEFMWTAGHCFPQNTVVQQGTCRMDGTTCYWTVTGDVGTVNDVEFGDNRMDWERVAPPTADTVEQRVYVLGTTSAVSVAESGFGGAALYEPICTEGSFTGENCTGEVHATNTCVRAWDDRAGREILVCNQTFAHSTNGTRLVQAGDSGGPVLAFDHGTRDTGFGVGVISNGTESGTDVGFTDGAAICNRTPGC